MFQVPQHIRHLWNKVNTVKEFSSKLWVKKKAHFQKLAINKNPHFLSYSHETWWKWWAHETIIFSNFIRIGKKEKVKKKVQFPLSCLRGMSSICQISLVRKIRSLLIFVFSLFSFKSPADEMVWPNCFDYLSPPIGLTGQSRLPSWSYKIKKGHLQKFLPRDS